MSKLNLADFEHDIRNATTCIAGILASVKVKKKITSRNIKDIYIQLNKIEDAIFYVRQSNKGDK